MSKIQFQLLEWMAMPQKEVLDKFASLPGAYEFFKASADTRSVFIEGERDDRVVLVAHSDTVWGEGPHSVNYYKGKYFGKDARKSKNKKKKRKSVGIGADDRAGCALLWYLKDLGHSILITSGEESGCLGVGALASKTPLVEYINETHQFAIQFDRQGADELVFYGVGSLDFAEYCEKETGYERDMGSFTDIAELCQTICGVNMSTGYYNEHTGKETLVFRDWLNTYNIALEWLKKKNLPRFEIDETAEELDGWSFIPSNWANSDTPFQIDGYSTPVVTPQQGSKGCAMQNQEGALMCPDCGAILDIFECESNYWNCIHCNYPI